MKRGFMKSSDLYATEGPNAPNWTDTEGFYKRIHWLTSEAHSASNDDEDIVDYFMCLEQLHLEMLGSISNSKDRQLIEKTRLKIKKWVYGVKQSYNLGYKREMVRPYHEILNIMGHKYGLFLRKTMKNTLDDWDEDIKIDEEQSWEEAKLRTNRTDSLGEHPTIQKM